MKTLTKAIGTDSSGLLKVFKIDYDIEDSVLYSFNGGPIKRAKIDYTLPMIDSGFIVDSKIYAFDEILRLTNDWTSEDWPQWQSEIEAYESES